MHLSDGEALQRNYARLEETLETGVRRVIVEGPTGSGRSALLARLRCEEGFVCIDPPPMADADAAIHALTQLAMGAGAAMRAVADDGTTPIAERAATIGAALAGAGKTVALRLPTSWRFGAGSERGGSPDDRQWQELASDLLTGIQGVPDLRIALLVSDTSALPFETNAWAMVRLGRMVVTAESLADLSEFGTYEPHARAVAATCSSTGLTPTPLQFRVAVGLRALAAFNDRDADLLAHSGSSLRVLEARLIRALSQRRELAAIAFRLAAARWPIPASHLASLTGVPREHEPLVRQCLGYGDSTAVRMHERIRSSVLGLRHVRTLRASVQAAQRHAHTELARHHRSLDGTAAMPASRSPVDWLERAHHLGQAGRDGAEEWESLELNSREFFWARGRALSLAGDHSSAAAVYRECLRRFGPRDAYAQHYLGFNLNRAGVDHAEAQASLEEAVRIAPENPWWNARLVTFHVEHSRFLAARQAWRRALEQVDPSGERVATDDWLAKNLHRWVVSAWLDVAQVALAREAFDTLPPEIVTQSDELSRLEERLLDAEEAVALGESVYPASIPPAERWLAPRRLSHQHDGQALLGWYPGRVVEANEQSVMMVFAVPGPSADARRVKVRELTREEWARAADFDPEGYLEIGSYEAGGLVILPVDAPRPSWEDDGKTHASAALAKWRLDDPSDDGR